LNILMLSPWLPWPPHDGARIRILETLKFLSQRHRVTLLGHINSEEERANIKDVAELCEEVFVELISNRADARLVRMMRAAGSGKPFIQGIHYSQSLARRVRALTEKRDFNIIHVELSLISRYVRSVSPRSRAKTILSTHNIESQRFERELKLSSWSLRRLVLLADSVLFRNWEERALAPFDGAIAVSEHDKSWLESRFGERPVGLVRNGVDTRYFSRTSPYSAASQKIVFTGVMDYPPNVDAVVWFVEAILPQLKGICPALSFQIVGARPSPRVGALAVHEGVEVTGEVDDIRPYVEDALGFVVPLRSGGGTRLKILQAMSMGCPVISTSIGAEGLELVAGENVLFAEHPDEFVEHIALLQAQPQQARLLGEAGRRCALERYDWQTCLGGIEDIYRRAMGAQDL